MSARVTSKQIAGMALALSDFGYPDVTDEEVADWCDELLAGRTPDDVCAMFVASWLDEAGLLPHEVAS